MSDTAATEPVTLDFQRGDILDWISAKDQVSTKRQVRFLRYQDTQSAIVSWGVTSENEPRRHIAPLRELRRPPTPRGPWFLPNGIQPSKPPAAPTEDQLLSRLTDRRDLLRQAHEKARTAQDDVTRAREVADRPKAECDDARAQLVLLERHDNDSLRELENALRDGRAPSQVRNGVDRTAVKHRVELAEAALTRFDRELAEFSTTLSARLGEVRKAAADVVAALLDREAESLRALEASTMKFRSELMRVTEWWPDASLGPFKMAHSTSLLLGGPPDYEAVKFMVPPERALGPWEGVFERLVSGEVEADFQLER